MATVTKAKIAEGLFLNIGLNKRESSDLVDLLFDEMKLHLSQGTQLKISAFGNFDLRDKASRPGRNPKTGEVIPVSARRVVTFKAGNKLRGSVDAYTRNSNE
jgi:integration host factor subunit alpha